MGNFKPQRKAMNMYKSYRKKDSKGRSRKEVLQRKRKMLRSNS